MKVIRLGTRLTFIICLPVFIFTAAIGLAFNTLSLYEYGFNKYGISEVTGVSPDELTKAARGLITYWNSGQELVDIRVLKDGQPFTLYNEREVVHLKDVKALVRLDYIALVVAGMYCLTYLALMLAGKAPGHRREIALAGLGGSVLTLGVLAVLGIAAGANFNAFWWQFHILSFANDFWLLDPRTDYLVMMFPEGFWFDCVVVIAGISGTLAIFTAGLSWAAFKRNPRYEAQKNENVEDSPQQHSQIK